MIDVLKFDFQFFTTYFVTGRPFSKAHFLSCTTKKYERKLTFRFGSNMVLMGE